MGLGFGIGMGWDWDGMGWDGMGWDFEWVASIITTDQQKMINSILDKSYSRINLDRIRIVTDTREEILLNSKEEVQAEAINTFSSIFRSRNHKFENLPEQWKDIYEPQADI